MFYQSIVYSCFMISLVMCIHPLLIYPVSRPCFPYILLLSCIIMLVCYYKCLCYFFHSDEGKTACDKHRKMARTPGERQRIATACLPMESHRRRKMARPRQRRSCIPRFDRTMLHPLTRNRHSESGNPCRRSCSTRPSSPHSSLPTSWRSRPRSRMVRRWSLR